jgi:hemerythrin-like domain-containing protein
MNASAMCDYCGCRAEPEIAALSAEHEHMLTLTAQLRRAHEAGVPATDVVAELARMLGPHARREERGVFAALLAEGIDTEYIQRFEHEHETLEELLSGGDAPLPTLQLVELLEGHILREESDLFPAAHQLLGSDAWAAIAAPVGDDDPVGNHVNGAAIATSAD